MSIENYRVLERKGRFYVQLKIIKTTVTGYLWWRKVSKFEDWVMCDDNGRQIVYMFRVGYISPPMKSFDTLKEAIDKIKINIKPDKIHSVI
jgi:hypothetical protein